MALLLLGEAHEMYSNTGAVHVPVDMIPTTNAQYLDEEKASCGHFSYRVFWEMAANTPPILQQALTLSEIITHFSYMSK